MNNNIGIAVGSAVVAGGFLAATGVLQQNAASMQPARESMSPRLLWSLAHNRQWLLGIGTGVVSYGFQALALAFGPLALVQPVFLSELLFAVPISVRLHGSRMAPRDWLGLLSVVAGLAVGILSARPSPGNPLPGLARWALAVGVIVAVAGAAVLTGCRLRGPVRSSFFALAAGAVMALQSAFLAAAVDLMQKGPGPLFTSWESYALVPATAVGELLVMSAYQAGPLAASMPVIDAAEPSIAIVIGTAVFGEQIRQAPWNLAGTACGLALFFLGIALLDTSPLVHVLHSKQASNGRSARPEGLQHV